jgi:hypothetical protein
VIYFLTLLLQLQLIITAHNQWLSETRSIPYWTTSVFSSTVTDLVLIYESVTSASIVRLLPLHSWTLNSLTNEWIVQSQSYFTTGGARPLETHDQRFFFQLNSCGNSPYITSSLTRRWVCLLWICLAFRKMYISHITCYWKFFLLHYTPVLCQYRLCRADHAYPTYLMLQRQLSARLLT